MSARVLVQFSADVAAFNADCIQSIAGSCCSGKTLWPDEWIEKVLSETHVNPSFRAVHVKKKKKAI